MNAFACHGSPQTFDENGVRRPDVDCLQTMRRGSGHCRPLRCAMRLCAKKTAVFTQCVSVVRYGEANQNGRWSHGAAPSNSKRPLAIGRVTLHRIRDHLPLDRLAQVSAQYLRASLAFQRSYGSAENGKIIPQWGITSEGALQI